MIQHRLLMELDRVAARYRHLRFWQTLALAWLLAALTGLVLWGLRNHLGAIRPSTPMLLSLGLALIGLSLWSAMISTRNLLWVARQIEATYPDLRSSLLAAIEQRPVLPDGRFGYLQSNVIRQALAHADHHPWRQVVSTRRLLGAVCMNIVSLGLCIAILAALMSGGPTSAAILSGGPQQALLGSEFTVSIEPGNTEVERGTSLLVLARVAGGMPAESALIYLPEGGEEARLAMSRSLEDPVFGGRIPTVDTPLAYHVELGDQITPVYHVTVFEYPRLERADAKLVYPSYTGMDEKLVQDVRTVSVVEGTELTLICHLNKPVATATLTEDKQPPISLSAVPGDEPIYQATMRCEKSRRLKLVLVDDRGRENVKPAEFSIKVLPNQPPTLKPTFPARDFEVSPLEEMDVKATVWDDYGLKRYGLTYSFADDPPVDVVLGENAAARQRHEVAHLIRFEDLNAEPDQLLSYHFWAEDFAPDGSVRRTLSDMYFAEARPFEEIFRQGEQPPGGQSQQQQRGSPNAQAAEQLAELQKDILNATWKLIRRELGDQLSDKFAEDVDLIHSSQESALEQAEALAEKVQDPQSQEHIATVMKAMTDAASHLEEAHDGPAREPLHPALASEQAAYQALLRLRAREHRVVRGQQQRGSSRGSSSRSRQQLQQLDLKEEENRYETQRMAQSQPDQQEERETRQVLNRLKELARRQHDLNERLKELQSALQEARAEEQREEIRRQLKRLQDEQREILRDTDELKARMESPENLERMTEAREQLDQTRDQVRRASESLEQEQVTQAAASGTRAEKDFEELRNEFRRRASNRFNEEMRQMRDSARELDQKEQDLSQRLSEVNQESERNKSLREDGERDRIAQELSEQRQRLGGLLDQMRNTIQEAEETEPLLSEKLYETTRQAQDQKVERALEATERSLRQGFAEDARQVEQAANRGISQLREGVERAAESVLGDETEALRRAREELRNLAEELNNELARNDPNGERPSGQPQGDNSEPRSPQNGQRQSRTPNSEQQSQQRGQGRNRQNQNQQGQTPSGQNQQGSNPSGQSQSGQPQSGQRQSGQRTNRRGARLSDPTEGGGNPVMDRADRRFAPLTGEDFLNWSDRLRDVEEMVDDPELRAEAARIRERARATRAEFKRHSKEPNWDLVRMQVAEPLNELRDRVAEELLRRTSKQALVPLDRDPVPPRYSEKTRLYYERLGSGK